MAKRIIKKPVAGLRRSFTVLLVMVTVSGVVTNCHDVDCIQYDGFCNPLLTWLLMGVHSTSPDSVSELTLWLKADTIDQTDESAVNIWSDSSGRGNQATAGTAPVYKTDIINGRPVVRFTQASSQFLNIATTLGDSADSKMTIFLVADPGSVCTSSNHCCGFATRNAGTGWTFSNNSSTSITYYHPGNSGDPNSNVSENFNIQVLHRDALDVRIAVNGTLGSTVTTAGFNPAGGANTHIGHEASNRYFGGDIAEIIVYDKALNDGNRQGVECYLSNKYTIAVNQFCLP